MWCSRRMRTSNQPGTQLLRAFFNAPLRTRLAVLVVAYEPIASRRTLDSAYSALADRACLESAVGAGLLLVRPEGIRLTHPQLRDLAMQSSSPDQRRTVHLALAGSALPHPLPTCSPDRLTARERQVAELASTGLRTAEIADELIISPKTVDYHLGKIYRKLGARSRIELGHLLRSTASAVA